jgi:hypothetical protein
LQRMAAYVWPHRPQTAPHPTAPPSFSRPLALRQFAIALDNASSRAQAWPPRWPLGEDRSWIAHRLRRHTAAEPLRQTALRHVGQVNASDGAGRMPHRGAWRPRASAGRFPTTSEVRAGCSWLLLCLHRLFVLPQSGRVRSVEYLAGRTPAERSRVRSASSSSSMQTQPFIRSGAHVTRPRAFACMPAVVAAGVAQMRCTNSLCTASIGSIAESRFSEIISGFAAQ